MRKVLLVLLVFLLSLSLPSALLAYDPQSSGTAKPVKTIKRAPIINSGKKTPFRINKPFNLKRVPFNLKRAPRATRGGREKLRERVGEKRAEIRKRLSERKKQIIRRISKRVMRRFEAAISRLENIINRFERRINKIGQKRDVGQARKHLILAKNHLKLAKAALGNFKSKFESLAEAENPREAMPQLRTLAKEVIGHLKEALKNLRLGVGVLKSLRPPSHVKITPEITQSQGGEE